MEKIYSTGEVAKLLGIARHKIEYAVTNGYVSEARFRFWTSGASPPRTFVGWLSISEFRSMPTRPWSRTPDRRR